MTGETGIHDPSVIEVGGRFVALGTGRQGPTHGAIRVKTSPDGIKLDRGGGDRRRGAGVGRRRARV